MPVLAVCRYSFKSNDTPNELDAPDAWQTNLTRCD